MSIERPIIASLLALALLTTACFDEIKLDLPVTDASKLVVEGSVRQGEDSLHVDLLVGRNAVLDEEGHSVTPIPIAEAYLICNDRPFPEFPLTNEQTVRLPLAPFVAQNAGDEPLTFRLRVTLPDGQVYESGPEPALPVPKAETIDIGAYQGELLNSLGNLIEQTFMEIKITTPLRADNTEKAFLKWDFQGVYRFVESPPPTPLEVQATCYLNHKIGYGQILVFNGRETTDDRLIRYPIIRDVPVEEYFAAGYYLTVYQQSLSAGAFRYWDQLRQNGALGGSLFDPAPGAVQGNVRNINDPEEPVLGYFYASQTDTLRRLIQPSEVKSPLSYCAILRYPNTGRCQDCTTIPGSTLRKPDYWVE